MKKVIITILIILAILVLGLSGYLVYDKLIDRDVESPIPEEKNELNEAKQVLEKFVIPENKGNVFKDGYTLQNKMILAYLNLSNEKMSDVSCKTIYNNLSMNEFSEYQVNLSLEGFSQGYCSDVTSAINYDDLNQSYKELFGNNQELPKVDFNYGFDLYDYNESTNQFILLSCNCGGRTSGFVVYGIKNVRVDGEELTISVAYTEFLESESLETYETIINNNKVVYNSSEVSESNFEKNFLDKYLNDMTEYNLIFVKQNGNYILKELK